MGYLKREHGKCSSGVAPTAQQAPQPVVCRAGAVQGCILPPVSPDQSPSASGASSLTLRAEWLSEIVTGFPEMLEPALFRRVAHALVRRP